MSEQSTAEELYAAPEAEVEVPKEQNSLFVVAPSKFMVMVLVTFGVYGLYFFYKHWKTLKQSEGLNIWPVPRAMFSLFFTHSLYRKIHAQALKEDPELDWNPGKKATQYVLISLSSLLAAAVSIALITVSPGWYMIFLCVWSVAYLVLMFFNMQSAQKVANLAEDDIDGEQNKSYTGMNIVCLLLFGGNWFNVLAYFGIGIFLLVTGLDLPME